MLDMVLLAYVDYIETGKKITKLEQSSLLLQRLNKSRRLQEHV